MTLPAIIILVVGAAATAWLGYVLARFNARRRRVIRCALKATTPDLEEIYAAIEALGSEPPNGYILARTNLHAPSDQLIVPLLGAEPFPWCQKQIEITVGNEVSFKIVASPTVASPQFLGKVYRPVAVPRHKTKSGSKQRNIFEPNRYFKQSERLRKALLAICPDDPEALLSYLLCAGRESFEFEPIDQARIGTSPAWVQDPQYPTCLSCRAPLKLILQVPGAVLSRSSFHRGTFFLFGCTKHPENTQSLGQFT
jgi:hypothetical protein